MPHREIKLELERKVSRLFPVEEVVIPPALLAIYAARQAEGGFAFGVDRQSVHQVMTDKEKTGHQARVEAVLREAERQRLYLPIPIEKLHREDGELPFIFDDMFWFVDGMKRDATGFSASPIVRPRLWDAYLTMKALLPLGLAPAAFIVAEGSRFFRAKKFLRLFFDALAEYRVKLVVPGFGEVNEYMLPGLEMMVDASAKQLKEGRKGAIAVRKKQGRPMAPQIQWGFQWSHDMRRVLPHPTQYPLLYQAVTGLFDGRHATYKAALDWLATQPGGVRRNHTWMRQIVKQEILAGTHHVFRTESVACQVVTEQGVFRDLDFTENGNVRYIKQPTDDPLPIPVDYTGTVFRPIPRETLAAIREIHGHTGRPVKDTSPRRALCTLATERVRCAHCGAAVRESNPPIDRRNHVAKWYLQCQCGILIWRDDLRPLREINAELSQGHTLRRPVPRGGLSAAVWELLWPALLTLEIPEGGSGDEGALVEREALEHERLGLEADIQAINSQARAGLYGDPLSEETIRQVNEQKGPVLARLQAVREGITRSAARFLESQSKSPLLAELRRTLRSVPEAETERIEFRRAVQRLVVKKVEVDLDSGAFTVYTVLDAEGLAQVAGSLGSANDLRVDLEKTAGGCTLTRHNFHFALSGSLGPLPLAA